jgi:O-acetyl-ADP-ribose deacetylase (regulator of RNase III)
MLKYVSGDLLKASQSYISQGVAEGNQEGLGTGLAFQISQRWPDVQVAFKRYARQGKFSAGDIFVVPPEQGRPGFIYLATQPNMYNAKISYLRKSLKRLAIWADANSIDSVAMPKIGAGLGKLDWAGDVKPLYEEYLSSCTCVFVVYEDYVLERDA